MLDLAKMLPDFRATLASHMDMVGDIMAITKALDEMLRTKLHEQYDKELGELNIDIPDAEQDLADISEAFELAMCFIENLAAIAPSTPLADSGHLMKTAVNNEGYLQSLSGFCSAYRRIDDDAKLVQVRIGGDCAALVEHVNLRMMIQALKLNYGKLLYDMHSAPITAILIKGLTDMTVQVQVCEVSTVQNHGRLDSLLPMFLSSPPPEILAVAPDAMPDLETDSEKFFSKAPQHILLSNLEVVATSLDIDTLLVPGLRKPGCKVDGPVASERALIYLKVVSCVKDVAAIASVLHMKLCVPLASQENLPEELVVTELPHWLAHLGHALSVLDTVLVSAEVASMESEGWVHMLPYAVARSFKLLVAHFRGRCIRALLDLWSNLLDGFASKTVAVCPQLGVCINDNSMDEPLAQKLVAGKLSDVVKSHNYLHQQLQRLTSSANRMSLAPRLQEHPQTTAAVSIALHALGLAKSSSTIARGLQLLAQVRHQQDRPQQMKKFLSHFPEEERGGVPQGFWRVVEAFAKESEEVLAPSPASAGSSCIASRAKGEGSQSEQRLPLHAKRPPLEDSQGVSGGPAPKLRRRQK